MGWRWSAIARSGTTGFRRRPHPAAGFCPRSQRRATPRQVALAFLVRRPALFTIPKAAQSDHVEEIAGAGELVLAADEVARLDAAFPLARQQRGLPIL